MPKIDTSKIEGFESMTPEQKVDALTNFEYDDNSSELERLHGAVSKANGEAADWKKKFNAQLSEEERKKQEHQEYLTSLEEKVKTLEYNEKVSGFTAKLVGNGYSQDLAVSTAKAMADGDTETVFANQQTFLLEHDKALKADAMKHTPKPPIGSGNGTEDFKKLYENAMANGNISEAAYYNRLMAESEARQE